MWPFASPPAARTKDTVIRSFNGQNCSFYNLNWINVRRSQKNGPMLFFKQNDFYTWKYDRLFPIVKNSLNKENILYVRHGVCGPHDNTNVTHMALGGPSVWHACSTLSGKLSDFTVWCHTWRKKWVNCAVLTSNSAGLRTCLSIRLPHRELCSSLRESRSFLSLPADTTMAPSQGTQSQHPFLSNSFSRWASHDIYIPFQIPHLSPYFKLYFLLFR
jgi:hypothetical protein